MSWGYSAMNASSADNETWQDLPERITKEASQQTYYTIRMLADRDRKRDAFRAYAYFRWVDDRLDGSAANNDRCLFLRRQQYLIDMLYRGEHLEGLCPEERLLADLVGHHPDPETGLHAYICHLMAVMAFDAERRGRLICERELADYTHHLAVGVTEAMHYFIGHGWAAPQGSERYLAVTGAHVTHMLRDTVEDIDAGYYNIPIEFLDLHNLGPHDIHSSAYRLWISDRVRLARECFEAGRHYLRQVQSLRCRLTGYAYMARFEGVLNTIERDNYQLRPQYLERKTWRGILKMGWSASALMLQSLLGGLP